MILDLGLNLEMLNSGDYTFFENQTLIYENLTL